MHVLIMAGGSGTRFWPVSRASRPKQFLPIIGNQPMVVATFERVRELVAEERIIVVVGLEHQAETERLFANTKVRILVEPQGRNTAPCIGLGAQFVDSFGEIEPIVVLPADHYIADPESFRQGLRNAVRLAADRGGIVTMGIVPTRPETGYGYIERELSPLEGGGIYPVRRFVEKPDLETARHYLASGNFYWNAGIFVATAKTLLEEFARYMPDFYEGLADLAGSFNSPHFEAVLAALYARTPGVSFDYAIMEKTSRAVYVIPCNCGWSDVGSWYSLYEVRRGNDGDEQGNVCEGDAWAWDCQECQVIARGKRWIAALGLQKVLIVDAEDTVLVADLQRSQEVKKIIDHLKQSGRNELL